MAGLQDASSQPADAVPVAFFNANPSFSPVRPANSSRQPTKSNSVEFAHQIKQLELEGNRLLYRESNNGNAANYSGVCSPLRGNSLLLVHANQSDLQQSPNLLAKTLDGSSISSPVETGLTANIIPEMNTIAELSAHLEAQRQQTQILQQKLLVGSEAHTWHSMAPVQKTPPDGSTMQPSHAALLASLGIPGLDVTSESKQASFTIGAPISASNPALASVRRPLDFSYPVSHMQKALKESQDQVVELRKRLIETNEVHDEQKRQFRKSTEELKCRLQEALMNRDSALDLRQKENLSQEAMIVKLTKTTDEVQVTNRQQEQALVEASRKLDTLQQSNYLIESSFSQIRFLLSDHEQKRGQPFSESERISNQSPAMLVQSLEKCLTELETQLQASSSKRKELEQELVQLKTNSSEQQTMLLQQQQERNAQITSEHELHLATITERANNARQQSANLQAQMDIIQKQLHDQIRVKDIQMTDLETKVLHSREMHETDRNNWQERRASLEHSLDEVQQECAALRSERDEAIRKHTAIESREDDFKMTVSRFETELEVEREHRQRLQASDIELREQLSDSQTRLSEKQREAETLERMLDDVKQECDVQLASAEKRRSEKNVHHVSSLADQLGSLTEKYSTTKAELTISRADVSNLRKNVLELTEKLDASKTQLEDLFKEKKQLMDILEDKNLSVETLAKERQQFSELCDKKVQEIILLKTEKEKLNFIVDEREKNYKTLESQSSNLSQVVEVSSRNTETIREEKERLLQLVNEKNNSIEQLKLSRESMSKKLKIREKLVRDLEAEKQKFSTSLEEYQKQITDLVQSVGSKDKDILEIRNKLTAYSHEKEKLVQDLEKHKASFEKEKARLASKLKAADADLKTAQEALETKNSTDTKVVKLADKMQKEVTVKRGEIDTLQTRVHWLEDKQDALKKEKQHLKSENTRSQSRTRGLLEENDKLTTELDIYHCLNEELRGKVSKLEAGLEKAALKNASTQGQVERFEQDFAKMQLHHQLEIKELQSTNTNSPHHQPIHFSRLAAGSTCSSTASTPVSLSQVQKTDTASVRVPSMKSRGSQTHTPPQDKATQKPSSTNLLQEHQKSHEDACSHARYEDVGKDLRILVEEMKGLISKSKEQSAAGDKGSINNSKPLDSTNSLAANEYYMASAFPHSNAVYSPGVTVPRGHTPGHDTERDEVLLQRWLPAHSSNIRHSSSEVSSISVSSSSVSSPRVGASSTPVKIGTPHRTLHRSSMRDTQDLCKRLEEKIESLSKMGDYLQKGNAEMADLMKVEGKKWKKVKQHERTATS